MNQNILLKNSLLAVGFNFLQYGEPIKTTFLQGFFQCLHFIKQKTKQKNWQTMNRTNFFPKAFKNVMKQNIAEAHLSAYIPATIKGSRIRISRI